LSKVNVRTYLARSDQGPHTQSTANDITGDGNYTLVGNASCNVSVPVLDVVSRKTHGSAGDFDIHLPLTGSPGIECRTGGANNNHTLVFTFANPLVSVASADVTSGSGSVPNHQGTIGTDPH